jgi:REP element-mobilizing transposase RayT
MVVGYHLNWTAYGWWLPNDPRGSSSHEIRVARIAELGSCSTDSKLFSPVRRNCGCSTTMPVWLSNTSCSPFSAEAVALIAEAFAATIEERNYTCYACAIMQDHVHVLIRRHRDQAEVMLAHLQAGSRERLIQSAARPANHPVWGGPGWKRFLNTRADIERVIAYIRNNPVVAVLPEQTWWFVKPYDGWLPRPARET